MKTAVFTAWSLLTLALMYLIPYCLSPHLKGFYTYIFWALLSCIYMLSALLFVRSGGALE